MLVSTRCNGLLDVQVGQMPSNIESLVTTLMDDSTWNIASLSSISRKYVVGVGGGRQTPPRKVYGGWVQDAWSIRTRLTLNLGVRYGLETGVFAEKIEFLPFLQANRPSDTNNFGPRVGFAYSLNDRTVIRGGAGKYFGEISGQPSFWTKRYTEQIHPEILYDGRPDFAVNPFNGPYPTYTQALATTCAVSRSSTCVRREVPSQLAADDLQIAYSYQGSLGVQRQIGSTASVEADYVTTRSRAELYQRSNINLTYNPATGVNYPFTDISRRPYPDFGLVNQFRSEGWSNYHALQTAFTRRMNNGWQASATYLLAMLKDAQSSPAPFTVAPDLGGEYSLSASDQRHRAVFNGIWQLPYAMQLSGLYFFGSGERFSTNYGGDLRQTGATGGRLRPDGTVMPRNALVV